MKTSFRTLTRLALVSLIIIGLSGCYFIKIQQGNHIDDAKVAQLQPGMSKEEVRYIMGTTALENAFDDDQWDYAYTLRDKRRNYTEKKVSLRFKNNRLQAIR